MTTPDIQQLKEWAEDVGKTENLLPRTYAAVEVIQSLPDAVVDCDKLRDVIAGWGNREVTSDAYTLYRKVLDLIPAPRPRTLGDMSLDELKTYVGGEVTVDGWANPTMLVSVIEDEGAVLARRLNKPWPFVEVRPLSDLTPVEAPEQETESTPEPVQPRPEDEPKPGQAWLVEWEGKEYEALVADYSFCPWVLHDPEEVDLYSWCTRDEVTPVRRLRADAREDM